MLGSTFAASRSESLQRLVLADTPASVKLWMQSISKLRSQLSEDVQKIIDEAEKDNDFENPKYQEAVSVFYKKYLCRVEPWPVLEGSAALRWLTEDTTVYGTM